MVAIQPFLTPANERSFSALVDRVVLETGKTGSLLSIIQYANSTIRECQALGLFARDLVEEDFTVDVVPYIWPRPKYFRSIRTVQYATQEAYPKFRLPGRNKEGLEKQFFYAADDYFAFSGALVGELIHFANYYWRKPLLYYGQLGVVTTAFPGGPYSVRKAYYDIAADQWMYLNTALDGYVTTLADADEATLRRRNASNWFIEDWYDLLLEGVKAKTFKQFDDPRSVASYSLYKQQQKVLAFSTGIETESFNAD